MYRIVTCHLLRVQTSGGKSWLYFYVYFNVNVMFHVLFLCDLLCNFDDFLLSSELQNSSIFFCMDLLKKYIIFTFKVRFHLS